MTDQQAFGVFSVTLETVESSVHFIVLLLCFLKTLQTN